MSRTECKPLPPVSASAAKRFWKKIAVRSEDECWEWHGKTIGIGYGAMGVGGRTISATRLAYFLYTGVDPYPFSVLHSCDNPRCCNGNHLRVGTQADNGKDMKDRGRTTKGRTLPCVSGSKNPSAKLTELQVREIKSGYSARRGVRAALARQYGVTWTVIDIIVKGRGWKHV